MPTAIEYLGHEVLVDRSLPMAALFIELVVLCCHLWRSGANARASNGNRDLGAKLRSNRNNKSTLSKIVMSSML